MAYEGKKKTPFAVTAAAAFAALVLSAAAARPSHAAVANINVPNFSFESPTVANVPPYATSSIDSWQKDGNATSTGIFYNTPDVPPQVDNANGNQLGFIFASPGIGLYQDLPATYAVGQSYQLTIAIQGGGGGMPLNTPIDFNLYYRDPSITSGDNRVPIATTVVHNNNASGSISHLSDFSVNLPAVAASDPWAGKNIGVQMIGVADPNDSGYWDVDNVRLTSVPEPGAVAGAVATALLGLRRRRRAPR